MVVYFHFKATPLFSETPTYPSRALYLQYTSPRMLRMARRNYRRVTLQDRERIIDAYEEEEDFITVAHTLGIKRTTAYEIVRKYQRTGDIESRHKEGGRPKKLDNEALDFLVMLIEDKPTISLRELNETLQEVFPDKPHVSDSTVKRALDGELITLKLCRTIPQDSNSERVKQVRAEFAHYMYEEGLREHRIYVDEMGFNLYASRAYGRAPRGQRVHRIVGGQRGNITLIAAISNTGGLVYHETHTQSVKKEIFTDFLTSLEAILRSCDNPDAVIVMDNAPIHRNIEEVFPNLNIKKLPPHSPFLNPIENVFSVLKARLKNHLNDVADICHVRAARREGLTLKNYRERLLIEKLNASFNVITPELCDSNYTHSNTYLRKCVTLEDIWE